MGCGGAAYPKDPMVVFLRGRYAIGMKSSLKRSGLLLIAAAVFTLLDTGCNTAKGVGKDVEKLGDKIQEKSGK